MAKIRVIQTIENNLRVFLFVNDVAALSQSDQELIQHFGEPEINLGGTFTTDDVDWTLPASYVKVVSGLPVRVEADITATPWSVNTTNRLTGYRAAILSRLTDAFTALRANNGSFTNEFVTQI